MAQEIQITRIDVTEGNITISKMPRIIWKIEDIYRIPQGMPGRISPEFYLTPESMCHLSFIHCSNRRYVYIRNKSDAQIQIQRTIVFYDDKGIKIYEERNATIFSLEKDKDVDIIGSLYDPQKSYSSSRTLIIELCVTELKGNDYLTCDIDPERKLKEDLKTMLENPVNSDISLQVGDEQIPAHWSILCSRSPYFKRMFESGMQERVQNSITITDLSLGTVRKLIQFLYTADFAEKDDLQEIFDLYYAADKYQVLDLKYLCACKIKNNVTVDNVCQILLLAHRHNDNGLKMEAMDFIQSHSEAVFQTDEWEQLKVKEPLATEFCSFFCRKK